MAGRAQPEELVFADHRDAPGYDPGRLRSLIIRPIKKTWRDGYGVTPAAHGEVIRYLDALRPKSDPGESPQQTVYALVASQLDQSFGTYE